MKKGKRYAFWKVFWVVLGIYVFFALLGVIAASVAAPATNRNYDWHTMLTWKHALSQLVGMAFSVFFYYFTLNEYYRLFASRQNTIAYIPYSLLAILVQGVYLFLSYK